MTKTKEELEKEKQLMKNLMSWNSTESAMLVGKANPSRNDQRAAYFRELENGQKIMDDLSDLRGLQDPETNAYYSQTLPKTNPTVYNAWKATQDDIDGMDRYKVYNGGYINPSMTAIDEAIEKRDAEEQKKEETKDEETPIDMALLETITNTSPSTPMPTYTTPAKVTGNQYTYNPLTYERKTTDGDSPVKGVGQDVYDKANAAFVPSAEVQAAWQLVANSREKLAQGTTPYTDKLNQLIDSYQNRGDFSYDPNADMLYQQYLSSMQNAGQMAMKDTMGQAAALTGGYGSSYATAAANGAYNNYLQTANDNLVNFYNMALDKYRLEGDEALQNINLAQMQDENAYNRMLNEYNANSDFANTLYNRALGEHDRSVAQAQNTMDMMRGDYWQDIGNQLNTEMHNSDMTYKYDTLNQSAEEYANSTAQNEAWRQYQAQMDAYNAEREQANWQKEFDFNVEQSEAKATNAIIEAAQKQAAEESSNEAKWGGRTNAQITNLYLDAYNVIKSAGRNEEKQRKALVSFFDTQNNLSEEAIADIETWLDNVVSGKVKVNKWED